MLAAGGEYDPPAGPIKFPFDAASYQPWNKCIDHVGVGSVTDCPMVNVADVGETLEPDGVL